MSDEYIQHHLPLQGQREVTNEPAHSKNITLDIMLWLDNGVIFVLFFPTPMSSCMPFYKQYIWKYAGQFLLVY